MVIKLVDITTQKRIHSDVVRPSISIPHDIWAKFKFIHPNKEIRDNIMSVLLSEYMIDEFDQCFKNSL